MQEEETNVVILVNKEYAKHVKSILESCNCYDSSRRTKIVDDVNAALPVLPSIIGWLQSDMSSNVQQYNPQLSHAVLPASKTRESCPRTRLLKALLQLCDDAGCELNAELKNDLPKSWQCLGDMVVLPVDCFTNHQWNNFGASLWASVAAALKKEKVGRKSFVLNNHYRTPQLQILYGQDGWVEHMDNGVRYCFDATKCMFSAGNITEKLRIANFDCLDEIIVDLYAGIGYFTLQYLVHTKASHVHACEWNPDAVEGLKRGLHINGVSDRCTVYPGDNRQVCPIGIADRVNLGLLPSSEAGWATACRALKPREGGILHIHGNVNSRKVHNVLCPSSASTKTSELSKKPPTQTQRVNDIPCDREHFNHGEWRPYSCEDQHVQSCEKTDSKEQPITCTVGDWETVPPVWRQWAHYVAESILSLLSDRHHSPWRIAIIHLEHVKAFAPHVDHLVVDILCRPL